jgi:hypothetical protein
MEGALLEYRGSRAFVPRTTPPRWTAADYHRATRDRCFSIPDRSMTSRRLEVGGDSEIFPPTCGKNQADGPLPALRRTTGFAERQRGLVSRGEIIIADEAGSAHRG